MMKKQQAQGCEDEEEQIRETNGNISAVSSFALRRFKSLTETLACLLISNSSFDSLQVRKTLKAESLACSRALTRKVKSL